MDMVNRFISITYRIRHGLALVSCAIAAFQIAAPVFCAKGFFDEFRIPYDSVTHITLILISVPGPLCHAGLILIVALRIFQSRALHWSMIPIGIAFAAWTIYWNGLVAHDFSHVLYHSCSGIFADRSAQMELILILAVAALWFATTRRQPGHDSGPAIG